MPAILDRKPHELKAGNSQDSIKFKGEIDRIQNIVNGLVWDHGSKVSEWAAWSDLLQEFGLSPKDVTPKNLLEADIFVRKKTNSCMDQPIPEEMILWKPPIKEGDENSVWDSWWTTCRRYRVSRCLSLDDEDNYFAVSYVKGTQQINGETILTKVPKKFKSIRSAFAEIEKIYCQQCGIGIMKSNVEKILLEAEINGFHLLPTIAKITTVQKEPNLISGENQMNVSEKDAREILIACGHEQASDWSLKRLEAKLNDVESYDKEGTEHPLLDEVVNQVEQGITITIGSEEESQEVPTESNGESKKKKGKEKTQTWVKQSKVANPIKASNFFIVDLRQIKGNTFQPRKQGVISNLNSMGYGLFEPVKTAPNNPTIWSMLTGNDAGLWAEAIQMLDENEPDIKELADSLAVHTQLQNIGLVECEGGYDVIYGMRRCIARAYNYARSVGDMPLTIKAEMAKDFEDELDLHFRGEAENKGRKPTTPMDIAKKFHFLKKNGLDIKTIAARDGISIQSVYNYLRLLQLTKEEQEKVHKGTLGFISALNLLDKRKGGKKGEPEKDNGTKRRLPSAKQAETLYRSLEKPEETGDEEWELLQTDEVRKFLALYLGFDFIPFEEMKEMQEAAAKSEETVEA